MTLTPSIGKPTMQMMLARSYAPVAFNSAKC